VSRAGTGPFERSRAASRQNRSTSHGDEEEWEEAHNEQKEERGGSEDGRTQDREKESREEDSRKEKASEASRGKEVPGPEGCCAQAGEEGGAEACPEARGGDASRAEAGSPGACGAASGRPADGSPGPSGAVTRHGEFHPAASRNPDGRRNAGAVRTASGNADVIARVEPELAALSAVLGARRRRYVMRRGRARRDCQLSLCAA
jgi:hypothetical protein